MHLWQSFKSVVSQGAVKAASTRQDKCAKFRLYNLEEANLYIWNAMRERVRGNGRAGYPQKLFHK